jgi:hypothetical protein
MKSILIAGSSGPIVVLKVLGVMPWEGEPWPIWMAGGALS